MLGLRILGAIGLAMITTGITMIVWGGILLEDNTLGFVGSIMAAMGILTLVRKV